MDCDSADPELDHIFADLLVHLILPSKCPQAQNSNLLEIDSYLLTLVQEASDSFVNQCAEEHKSGWQSVEQLLSQWVQINSDASIHPFRLDETITALPVRGSVALHIRAQNSGIMLHRTEHQRVVFELFEAAPRNADVMATGDAFVPGRLTRNFPGSAITCPWKMVTDEGFRYQLGKFLCGLNEETVHAFQNSVSTTAKADPHDTPHPGMITEMFANLLAAHGEVLRGKPTTKHTREESYLGEGAKRAWRRTPLWLVIKVAIVRALTYAFPTDEKQYHYKNFILYFLAQIATKACREQVPHELRHLLSVKLARRLAKLHPNGYDFVVSAGITASKDLNMTVQAVWADIQEADNDARLIPKLDMKASLDQMSLQLEGSRRPIITAIEANHTLLTRANFRPRATKRLQILKDGLPQLSTLEAQKPVTLVEFENWVASNLNPWLDSCTTSAATCLRLKDLIEKYLPAMMAMYRGCCERFSIGVLTVLEIWVALDKVQCALNPLLEQYSPGLPASILEPLLLRKKDLMFRAQAAERYLHRRQYPPATEVLDLFSHMELFFMRFFDQSKIHQKIRTTIDSEATAARQQKTMQWQELEEQYASLMQGYTDRDHDVGAQGQHDDSTCEKCIIEAEAESLKIVKHEWPLPKDEDAQKVLIVEMEPPFGFRAWRDATWALIHDLGQPEVKSNGDENEPNAKKAEEDLFLTTYNALSRRYVHGESRIMLKAIKKPAQLTGRKTRKIPCELDHVCINNESIWTFFDKQKAVLTSQQRPRPDFGRFCTYQLPDGPYSHLQWTVASPDYSDNRVVAQQNDCPTKINLNEHYDFGSLRSGRHLQLINILGALAGQNLNVKNIAIQTLFSQVLWEFGPMQVEDSDSDPASACIDSHIRITHAAFDDELFCEKLLVVLGSITEQTALSTAEQNTDGLVLIAIVILRLVSFATSEDIRAQALEHLRKLRKSCLLLLHRLAKGPPIANNSKTSSSNYQLFKLATLAKMTFDVDIADIAHVLSDDQDVEDLTTASLVARENLPGDIQTLPYNVKEMVLKGIEISRTLESDLRALIIQSSNGLNGALLTRSEETTLKGAWSFLQASDDRHPWIEYRTSSPIPRLLHYNILTGEFMISGQYIRTVPFDIERDPMYQRLIGQHALKVLPSNAPGMQYTSMDTLHGHKLHFRHLEDGKVVIRASFEGRRLELIPNTTFKGDLPDYFVQEFVHWLDLDSHVVELRHIKTPFNASSDDIWKLDFKTSKMSSSDFTLVPQHHPTFRNIQSILNHLETASHILIFVDCANTVHIELRRYGLKFSIDKHGDLVSRDFDAVVDRNQDLGCLVGLQNKLVLRSKNDLGSAQRHVLIPFGPVILAKHKVHISINIDLHIEGGRAKYFHYRCDEYLKIIQTPADRLSTLFLAYLHATCAFILADPWTEQTGTQRALQILRQPMLKATAPLTTDEISVLETIARLTPDRRYRPVRKKEMQEVSWDPILSSFSQHEDFYFLAQEIKQESDQYSMLYNKADPAGDLVMRENPELLWRARIRNSWFRTPDLMQNRAASEDHVYHSRDTDRSERGNRVYKTATVLRTCPKEHNVHPNLFEEMLDWPTISGFGDEYSPRSFQEVQSISLNEIWGSLYEACRNQNPEGNWKLSFLLSQVAFKDANILQHVETLLAISCSEQFGDMAPPSNRSYELSVGLTPSEDALNSAIKAHRQPFKWPCPKGLTKAQKEKRLHAAREEHRKAVEQQLEKLRDDLVKQWPDGPIAPAAATFPKILVASAVNSCATIFARARQNAELHKYVQEVQIRLNRIPAPDDEIELPAWSGTESMSKPEPKQVCPDLLTLLRSVQAPPLPKLKPGLIFSFETTLSDTTQLGEVLCPYFPKLGDHNLPPLGEQLKQSFEAYRIFPVLAQPRDDFISPWDLQKHLQDMRKQSDETLSIIQTALQLDCDQDGLLAAVGVRATTNPYSLLRMLSHDSYQWLPLQWKQVLTKFATRLALFQRAERLVRAATSELIQELQSCGQEDWSAESHPDWILIEIEQNLTIRPHQARLAMEMCSPVSSSNLVYQVKMGDGKTKVITPLLAATISDGTTLARVLVMKPLLRQSYEQLSSTLGRLINRRVCHLPFSRRTPISKDNIGLFMKTHKALAESGGVLVETSQQILSFKLAVQAHMRTSPPFALQLAEIEENLSSIARDIVDESDEILDPKSQVVWTVGTKQQIEGHPNRWIIIIEVLGRLGTHAIRGREDSRHFYTITERQKGAFPSIRFLQDGASRDLINKIVDDVKLGLIPGLPFQFIHPGVQPLVVKFIKDLEIDQKTADSVAIALRFSPHIWQAVLLLRGLIAMGYLQFVLEQKRFFVDYGLANLEQSLLVVPFRAKGIPDQSSQFGDKEVEILLTALAYYYTGLTDSQMHQAFSILLEDRDAVDEYRDWYSRCSEFPSSLQHLHNVNLEDEEFCIRELFPELRHSQGLLNFYMKRVVFARFATEHTKRVTASAWDLPSSDIERPTVGFSGTDDNQALLPLSIKQCKLPSQQHTNALVIDLIIREENRSYIVAADEKGSALSTPALLKMIADCQLEPSVIIDVGAQILDLTNREVAASWLAIKSGHNHAIYYDENDDPQVIDRDGTTTLLAVSPLRDRLDNTLIFLDQVRTRGTDLKMPSGTKAAVLLGPRLRKDPLIQACMRMRKLGMGHTLMFVAPPDCHRSILLSAGTPPDQAITSIDVVKWTIEQTISTLQKDASLWVLQGAEYVHRESTLNRHIGKGLIDGESDPSHDCVTQFLQEIELPESRSLVELYNYHAPDQCFVKAKLVAIKDHRFARQLHHTWSIIGSNEFSASAMQQEVERQVSIEIEKEEVVEHPSSIQALTPLLSPGVKEFVRTGQLPNKPRAAKDASNSAIYPASLMMERTSALPNKKDKVWNPKNIFVTRDFVETIDAAKSARLDPYLRRVRWILASLVSGEILIISPHEANDQLEIIKQSKFVRLHLYGPRLNQSATNMSKLDFYFVSGQKNNLVGWPSAEVIRDINLLAGSLYLDSFEQYEKLLKHLGVLSRMEDKLTGPGWNIGGDGFADPEARKLLNWKSDCPFSKSPIPFFETWISVCLKGQDFGSSHLGHITSSRPLLREHFRSRKLGMDDDESLFCHDSAMDDDENEDDVGAFGGGEAMVID
ncbi:hypothetical protein FKW77_008638 [Venturia effusa]|uniref:ubiquitinyl hydrolase 1 n=1 Tax=Venturia effusa TaxID=50376 RepID=A0A517L1T8_9PEZI|nr:hypothetical protein FKW77_008638 [Venturia effusa]